MKPRIGVYLSQHVAARLAVAGAVQRPGVSRSALVEAALDRYLGPDEDPEQSVNSRLGAMNLQLEQLTSDLKIVSETVALQARFHLAMTPRLPAAALRKACTRGSERFDEFAAQVQKRIRRGTHRDSAMLMTIGGRERCGLISAVTNRGAAPPCQWMT
jgi:hypothetical protein